jgi:hypothetical protein
MLRLAIMLSSLVLASTVWAGKGVINLEEAIEAFSVRLSGTRLVVRSCESCRSQVFAVARDLEVHVNGAPADRETLKQAAPGVVIYDVQTNIVRLVLK